LRISAASTAQQPADFAVAALVEAGSAPGARFGNRCRRNGVAVHRIHDDVTSIWYRHLDQQWRERPFAIAGLTRWPALFCLDELAREHRLSVVHHCVHAAASFAQPVHETVRSPVRCRAADLRCARSGWPELVADTLARMPLRRSARVARFAWMPRARDDDMTTLHSWIIAPASHHGAA